MLILKVFWSGSRAREPLDLRLLLIIVGTNDVRFEGVLERTCDHRYVDLDCF